MNPFIFLLGCLVPFVSVAAPVIGDFKTKIYHGNENHPNLWAIEIAPPEGHHFNLEAPRSAQQEKLKFDVVEQSPEKILFQGERAGLATGSVTEVVAFVCDEKKTYCMKKKNFVTLNSAQAQTVSEAFSAKKPVKTAVLPEKSGLGSTSNAQKSTSAAAVKTLSKKPDVFIDNDPAAAKKDARKTGKPVLIDFYGIWCPPCNLYSETIFHTREFAAQGKQWIFLKLDADAETSFDLKSRFKVGGYPTLLLVKLNAQGQWEELERIVGYFPPKEFYSRLNQAYAHRNDTPDQRWKGRLEAQLSSEFEQKNYDRVIELTENKSEPNVLLYRWMAQEKKNPNFLQDPKNLAEVKATLQTLAKNFARESSDTLVHAVSFLSEEFWLKQAEFKKMAYDQIDELHRRIDSATLFVKGTELMAPDLEAIRMDVAEMAGDMELVGKIRKSAITQYEKLIRLFETKGKKDLRSMNLEYAYLLWKDDRIAEAKKLYQRFIDQFTSEFTFYFAAAKMYLTLKEYPKARELAEKAFQYSYGDNRIRSMERLVSVMGEQGQRAEAVSRGNEFLKTVRVPEGLNVRTGRYVEALKKTIAQYQQPIAKDEKKK